MLRSACWAALTVAVAFTATAWCAEAPKTGVLPILQEAEQAARAIPDPGARAAQLADIAEARAFAGDFTGGLKLVKGLRKGDARDSALVTLVEVKILQHDLGTAQQVAALVGPDWQHFALTPLAAAQAEAGQTEAARGTAGRIKNVFDRGAALHEVAAAQARRGDIKGARQTAQQIEVLGRGPGGADLTAMHGIDLGELAFAQADGGHLRGALETVKQVKAPETQAAVMTHVAELQMKAGDAAAGAATYRKVGELAAVMVEPGARWHTYLSLGQSLGRVGRRGEAAEAFGRALRVVKGLDHDLSGRVNTLTSLALAQTEAEDPAAAATFRDAITAAGRAGTRQLQAVLLMRVATAQAQAGDAASAAATRDQAMQFLDELTGPYRSDHLRTMVWGQASTRDFAGARRTAALIAEEPFRVMALEEIAAFQASAGETEAAREAAAALPAGPYRASALRKVVMAQARAGEFAAARATAQGIAEPSERGVALESTAKLQALAGQDAAALAWARELASPLERAGVLVAVADGLIARAHPDLAKYRETPAEEGD